MAYATFEDRNRIEAEGPWEARGEPASAWGLLDRSASRFGARKALSFQMFADPGARAETLTWAELRDQTARVANMFRALGIGPDDTVAYLLPNCTEVVLCYLGGMTAGKVNPINPLLDAEQIGAILRESGARVLVTLRAFPKTDLAQTAARALALAPNVTTVLQVDFLRYLTGAKKLIVPLIRPKVAMPAQVKVLDFHAELARHAKTLGFAPPAAAQEAALFHTGGTTGMPKLARHRHAGIVYNAWLGQHLLFTEKDTILCPLPMFHVFAAVVCMGAALASGAHIVFPTPKGYRGDGVFDNFWKLVERWGVTFLITVPTAMSALMQRPVNADISTMKLAFSGSAPLPVELYRRFEAATGVTICEGYGLTEATCLVAINPPDGVKKIGSVGLSFPYTTVRILDVVSGAPVGPDQVGEICIASPGVAPGDIYLEQGKNAEMYRRDPDGRWFLRTGDLGRLDGDGYVWITGRAKDLIIRGGHNIDPAEIEEALVSHPAVAFAGAIGQPDAHAGELPCAYVELVKGAQVTEAELLAHACANVRERAAQPKHVEILAELPKTAVGKVFKPDLRRRAITRVYNEALANGDVAAEVVDVLEDKKRGLVAYLRRTGTVEDTDVVRTLGPYIRPWDWDPR